MTKLAVLGASGRMGRAVVRLAKEAEMTLVLALGADAVGQDAGELAGVGRAGVPVTSDVGALAASGADVLIDFSSPAAFAAMVPVARAARVAIVSGTTGLGADELALLDGAAADVPALWEPNMSVGVYVLGQLAALAARALGEGFDVEIVEAHHHAKVDAPSGTALRLAERVKAARDGLELVHGREGKPGPRKPRELGMHALRGGDVIGDHTVHYLGEGERIELTHRASSRELFARGAVRAAAWVSGKPAGRYGLSDVLALGGAP